MLTRHNYLWYLQGGKRANRKNHQNCKLFLQQKKMKQKQKQNESE